MAIINKSEREHIKESLKKPKLYPYFTYFPKGGGLLKKDPILEFFKTKTKRNERVKALKSKHGNKFARGLWEKSETAKNEVATTFKCEKPPPRLMMKHLDKMQRIVPNWSGPLIIKTLRDDQVEAEEVHAAEEAAKALHGQVLEDDQAAVAALEQKLRKTPQVLDQAKQALARFEKLTAALAAAEQAFDNARPDLKQLNTFAGTCLGSLGALRKRAVELKVKPVFELGTALKRGLEQDWGAMAAVAGATKTHFDEGVDRVDQCAELRAKIDGPKSLGRFVAALEALEEKVGEAQADVYSHRELLVRLLRGFEAANTQVKVAWAELETKATDQVMDDQWAGQLRAGKGLGEAGFSIDMPTAPDEILGSGGLVPDVPALNRLHATAKKLAENPWNADLREKRALIDALEKVPAAAAGDRADLIRMVLLSSQSATKLRGKIAEITDQQGTETFAAWLIDKGFKSSLDATSFLTGVREFWVEIESKFKSVDDYYPHKGFLDVVEQDPSLDTLGKDFLDTHKEFRDFPAHYLQASVATYSDTDGSRSVVQLPSSGRVIVVGGGPIGLMCAMEARSMGSNVTLFEGRANEYTRENVLALQRETVNRLERYGLYKELGLVDDLRFNVKVKDIEDTLLKLATAGGVRVEKGSGVTAIDQDPDTKEMICSIGDRKERAKLVIVAVGAGIASENRHAGNVIMADQLGIKVDQFGLADHVVSSNLKRGDRGSAERDKELDDMSWSVVLTTPTDTYVLTQVNEEEFNRIQNDKEAIKEFVLRRAEADSRFADLDIQAVGRFKVTIQRADKFVGKGRAVIVGDSAATPHPEQGSGTNTGAIEVDNVGDLVRGLIRNAKARFGEEDRLIEDDLATYDQAMDKIVTKATRKGVHNMLSVRHKAVGNVLLVIHKVRVRAAKVVTDTDWDQAPVDNLVKRLTNKAKSYKPSSALVKAPAEGNLLEDWPKMQLWGGRLETLDAGLQAAFNEVKALQDQGIEAVDRKLKPLLQDLDSTVDFAALD